MEDLPLGASWSIIICVCLALVAVVCFMDASVFKLPPPPRPILPEVREVMMPIPRPTFAAPDPRVLNSFPANVVSIVPSVAPEATPLPLTVHTDMPKIEPKHDLVIQSNDPTYGSAFWTFKLKSKSPSERIKEDLVRVLPAGDAKCMVQTFGRYAPGADQPLPLLSQGGRAANVNYIDPNGTTVPVKSFIGFTNQKKDTLALRVTLNSALPASYYTTGVFLLFKGQDCIGRQRP